MSFTQRFNSAIRKLPTWPLYIIGVIPAAVYFYLAISNQLGADPLKALEHQLGIWALQLLIAGLLVTPLRRLCNLNLLKFRRAIGLLAFFYTSLHLLTYLWLDQQWVWAEILKDVSKRPYIVIGMIAFTAMIPLAVTSNNASIRRLGSNWGKLHKLVYLTAICGAIHYLLLVKAWPLEPFVYLGIVLALVAYRYIGIRRRRLAV